MEIRDSAEKNADSIRATSTPENFADYRAALDQKQEKAALTAGTAPAAQIADGVVTFLSPAFKDTGSVFSDSVREIKQIFSTRDVPEDEHRDRVSVEKELADEGLEAGINSKTRKVLLKDADEYPYVQNDDGSTTFHVVQIGMTNRPINSSQGKTGAKYYTRVTDVTVPLGVVNLGDCQFNFGQRRQIQESEFSSLLKRDRVRLTEKNNPSSNDVNLHAHGVYTYTNMADQEAILLELTNGHPLVNIDWQAFPNTRDNPHHFSTDDSLISSYLHYMQDRASAVEANAQLEPLLDHTIEIIGADHTTMIGFSHGGMFDTRYLRHRYDSHLPKLQTVVFAHPDVPVKSPELIVNQGSPGVEGLLSAAASRAYVIGGQDDTSLKMAAFVPGASGQRLGNDAKATRLFVLWNHGDPVSEVPKLYPEKSDRHFLNYSGIASVENGEPGRSQSRVQEDFEKESDNARRH